MKLSPLTDRVVLKQLVAEETTKSGIVLPGQNKEKPQQAEVVAVGPGGMVDGKEVKITDPNDANELGIGMVHQHFKLVDVFTAAENIVLGLEEKLDMKTAVKKIKKICDLLRHHHKYHHKTCQHCHHRLLVPSRLG